MKISHEILDALTKCIGDNGNVAQFAKMIGISHSTVIFWLSGKTRNINGSLWVNRVRPVLAPYLRAAGGSGSSAVLSEPLESTPFEQENPDRKAPLVPFEMLKEFNPVLLPLEKFVNNAADGAFVEFTMPIQNGWFAVKVDAPVNMSMPELYFLLDGKSCPDSNGLAVVKLHSTGEVIACNFKRVDNKLSLTSFYEPGKVLHTWNLEQDPYSMIWAFPVLEIKACRTVEA